MNVVLVDKSDARLETLRETGLDPKRFKTAMEVIQFLRDHRPEDPPIDVLLLEHDLGGPETGPGTNCGALVAGWLCVHRPSFVRRVVSISTDPASMKKMGAYRGNSLEQAPFGGAAFRRLIEELIAPAVNNDASDVHA